MMSAPVSVESLLTQTDSVRHEEVGPTVKIVERLIIELGASDLFVFRQVAGSRFVHVGGAGRGSDAADGIEMDVDTDPLGSQLRVDQPLWSRHREPRHIFGPYYAVAAAAVRLSEDVLAVFGATTAEAADFEPTAAQLIETAGHAAELVGAVTPGADPGGDLDVPHSLRTLTEGRALEASGEFATV